MKKTITLTEVDLHRIVKECVNKLLKESYQSTKLKYWAKSHGGIRKRTNPSDTNSSLWPQDSLGDVTDDQIIYFEEFPSYSEADAKKSRLTRPNGYGTVGEWGMKAFFTIYTANDGSVALVGLDRNTFKTGSTWGGEASAKKASRMMK